MFEDLFGSSFDTLEDEVVVAVTPDVPDTEEWDNTGIWVNPPDDKVLYERWYYSVEKRC